MIPALAPEIAAMLTRQQPTAGTATHQSQNGDDPWSWVRDNLDWASYLIKHGWTGRRGDKYWVRPGKDPRDGHSAQLHDDGRLAIWTGEIPVSLTNLGSRQSDGGISISLADFICAYEYGGDRTLFGREFRQRMPPSASGRVGTDGGEDDASADALEGGSWFTPVDLTPILDGTLTQPTPTILCRNDGVALFYPCSINGIHGESGLGKGWVALTAAVEQVRLGATVIYLDMEDTLASISNRLLVLGLSRQQIVDHLVYVRPDDPTDKREIAGLLALVKERQPSLVILDSLGEAFGLDGIDENSDAEVAPWLRRLPRAIADLGPCVIIVDHVTKAMDNPLYQKGSGRKRAVVGGAQYLVEVVRPLVKGGGGRLRLTCAKDRNGTHARGATACEIAFAPSGDDMLTTILGPASANPAPRSAQEQADEQRENCALDMLRVARRKKVPFTKTAIVDDVDGYRAMTKRSAFNYLVEHNQLIEVSKGKFKASALQ